LRYSIAWPGSAALGCMDAEDAVATEYVTGARADFDSGMLETERPGGQRP